MNMDTIQLAPPSVEPAGNGKAKSARVDLGLALLALANPPDPGRSALTSDEIAAWCGCSRQAIQRIEARALRKVRLRLLAALATASREEGTTFRLPSAA